MAGHLKPTGIVRSAPVAFQTISAAAISSTTLITSPGRGGRPRSDALRNAARSGSATRTVDAVAPAA
ncbi:hypothetical protein [Azospirillum sp. B506]|uniref:hypothetical protein n=1 Tax=Azospirillum sp. B506 TaxID=137721 RepID=UPI0011DDA7F1|nr:hypothetical protein [Azospirillum sp. B506]